MKVCFTIALILVFPFTLRADVTYLDATLSNTNNALGGGDSSWADGDDGTSGGTITDGLANNDGKWRFRSSLGNGGIWEATGSSAEAEDCVELVTSVAVANETYDVYVFYYPVSTTGNFPVRAGFASAPNANPVFDRAGNAGSAGQVAATLNYEIAPPTGGESRTLLYGFVGQVEVINRILDVYIDDFPAASTGSSNDRTWYAGIGYEVAGPPPLPPVPDQIEGTLISIAPEAAWTWYTDERAIVDTVNGTIIAGGVRGKNWFGARGDILANTFDLASGQRTEFVLGGPPSGDQDDHNTASFIKLSDDNYLASWSSHSNDNFIRFRRSTNPSDATAWNAEQTFERSASDGASGTNNVTYTNLHFLSAEGTGQGRIYNIFRNEGAGSWDRYFIYSDDLGQSWSFGGRITGEDTAGVRPYLKLANNGVDTIYFIASETASGNSIWSGYIKGGKIHKMDGVVVDNDIFDNAAPPVNQLTSVMLHGTLVGGESMENHWPRDMELDENGQLAATWRALVDGSGSDWRHFYGRWDGSQWIIHQLAYAGDFNLLFQQNGTDRHRGTPLSALNPSDVNVVYFTGSADPSTGIPLVSAADGRRNLEVFKAETDDLGVSWTYTQITRDSSCHNFRINVLSWDEENTAVMWMRGYYDRWNFHQYNGWDCALVAWLDRKGEVSDPFLSYTDADLSNTTMADGTPLSSHTTGTNSGADDNNWHYRTSPSFGNNGTLFTANESTPYAEDCPVMKTTIPNVAPGTYDIFACFWSPRGDDYDVMAGLDETSLSYLERSSSQHAPASEFNTTVRDTDASRHLYRGYAGRVTLTASGPVEVFIDQFANDADTSSRTWYDGIALQRVGKKDTDSDGDGHSDADEVIAGTDPLNPDEFFNIISVTNPASGTVNIEVAGKVGRIYQLWKSNDLAIWAEAGMATAPLASDGLVQLTATAAPYDRSFFRIEVSLP